MSTDLEKDFAVVSTQINAKLKEAAKLINEASRLSDKFGLNGSLIHTQWTEYSKKLDLDIDEEDDRGATIEAIFEQIDVSALEGALGEAGWSTSSSYC